VGRDSASSAQSRQVGSGETVRLGPSRGERGWINGERRVSAGADGVVGDAGGVYQTDDAETARLRGGWGKQGGWDTFRGCSESSSSVFRCSRAVVRGLEWGRAGNSAVVDERVDDNVVVMSCGSGHTTGSWGTSWGSTVGSGRVYRRFLGVGSRSERGRSGGAGVDACDVASAWGGTGNRGTSWVLGTRLGGSMDRRWRLWSWQESSVEQTTHSSERVCA
jgi:hypothetical protein